MATNSDIGVSQPAASTITMKVRTVTQDVNSTTVHQEVLTLGGAESALEIARVIDGTPSTHYGLVTRSVIYDGGDSFRVQPGSSAATVAFPVRIVDSSGTGFAALGLDYPDGSTTSTLAAGGLSYNNGSNTTMRIVGVAQPLPVQIRTGTLAFASTTAFVTSTASTAVYELVSSVAGLTHKVYAVHLTSTHVLPSTGIFMSSLVGDIWGGGFGSGSSGMSGFNVAVSPPAFLFKTRASEALNIRLEQASSAASTTLARVSISYFTE
jgi:hypothetical protein